MSSVRRGKALRLRQPQEVLVTARYNFDREIHRGDGCSLPS